MFKLTFAAADEFPHREYSAGCIYKVYSADSTVIFESILLDNKVHLSIFLKRISNHELHDIVMFITEQMIRKYHPKSVLIHRPVSELCPVLKDHLYYPKGHDMQRMTEPYRLQLKDSVFDPYGYIINQGLMQDIPFGWFDTREKGCGWIAAYNLLKMNHKECTMQQCKEELESHAILGEVMGQSLYGLLRFLSRHGISVRVGLPSDTLTVSLMKHVKSGILLYNHSRGAHYTAFQYDDEDMVHFYNAVYGKMNDYIEPEDFLNKRSLFRNSVLIYVK